MLARCVSTTARSALFISRSCMDSNPMVSWRGVAAGGEADVDGFFILLLLDDSGITLGASPETIVHEQMV
jgi:hypothetical protein